jgi:hypothetical protein
MKPTFTNASIQNKVIAELLTLRFGSIEFYDVAGHYFCRRLRVIRNCGLFFIIFGALSLALVIVLWGNWALNIVNFAGSCAFALLGRTLYLIGKYEIQMIKTARKSDTKHQMNTLHFMATKSKPFRGDPVGGLILHRFNSVPETSN